MTIQRIPGGLFLPMGYNASTAAPVFSSSTALTTANSRAAIVFQVPRTGTLDWFETRQALNSNNPDNGLHYSFQDVGTNGDPDNTEDQFAVVTAGFGAGVWLAPPGYMGSTGTGSGSKRSVTRGDWLACVIKFASFVASDSVNMTQLGLSNVVDSMQNLKYNDFSSDGGVSYGKVANNGIVIALKYDDGTYEPIGWPDGPLLTINTRSTFNTGSTPDERGLLFQLPFPARIAGG